MTECVRFRVMTAQKDQPLEIVTEDNPVRVVHDFKQVSGSRVRLPVRKVFPQPHCCPLRLIGLERASSGDCGTIRSREQNSQRAINLILRHTPSIKVNLRELHPIVLAQIPKLGPGSGDHIPGIVNNQPTTITSDRIPALLALRLLAVIQDFQRERRVITCANVPLGNLSQEVVVFEKLRVLHTALLESARYCLALSRRAFKSSISVRSLSLRSLSHCIRRVLCEVK